MDTVWPVHSAYTVANGIRVFSVEDGTGPLVLFLHGWPESHYSWRHQLPALAGAGYRAVAIDLPGYGLSDKPEVDYDIVWIGDVLVDLIANLGHERAVVVGHDWGGLIVWPFARLHPERVAGVVGVNTPDLERTDVPPVELIRQIRPGYYIVQFQQPGAAEAFIHADIDGFVRLMFRGPTTVNHDAFGDDVLEVYADTFRPLWSMTPPMRYYRSMDRNWELMAPYADRKVEVPGLMIMAEGDPVLRPDMADGMEERVPNLRKVLVPDCGHWTQQERPDEVNEALVSYLRTLEPWS